MNWKKGRWSNGKRTLTGSWAYVWSRDMFVIHLNSKDPITGRKRNIETFNDTPEWGKWRLIEDEDQRKEAS